MPFDVAVDKALALKDNDFVAEKLARVTVIESTLSTSEPVPPNVAVLNSKTGVCSVKFVVPVPTAALRFIRIAMVASFQFDE